MVPDALSGGPHFAAYCERYIPHAKGRWAGRPLIYEPWQQEFWWEALEFDPSTGLRIHNEVGLGIPRKNTKSGKIERFQQTLKRWLGQQPAARTIAELQRQLDAFRHAYNELRPHRATGRATPGEAYRATPKAHPAGRGAPGHFRLRYDIADKKGAITLRRAGRLYHLKVGAAHARRRVLAIVDEAEVTVVALDTGEILSTHRIEPAKGYWRNTLGDPGRWRGPQATGGSQ